MSKKSLMTICLAVAMVFAVSTTAEATLILWEIPDVGLQNETKFVPLVSWADGTLNDRSDIAGDPGTQFDITTNTDPFNIIIANNFDLTGMSSDIVPIGTGGMGDLLVGGYTGYTMSIYNPSNITFNVALMMNTGWTDGGLEPDNYYQDTADGTSIAPGVTETLILDFSSAARWDDGYKIMVPGETVLYTNHISNIGLKIWTDGSEGPFNVDVVPEPATVALLGLGGLFLRRRRA